MAEMSKISLSKKSDMSILQRQLRAFEKDGKPMKYLVNYVYSMDLYTEAQLLQLFVGFGYDKNEVIECFENDFVIDMAILDELRKLEF